MAQASREFYQLRKYALQTGPQLALAQNYFEHALIPALNRMAMAPVGAFKLDIGPETPTYYLLIPATSVEALATLDTRLTEDAEFMKASAAFWGAPAAAPAFVRVESSLMSAFAGFPKIVAPKERQENFPTANLRERKLCRACPKSTDVQRSGNRNLYAYRIDSRVLRRHIDRDADAKPDLHADVCGYGGPECEMERVCNDPAWKELSQRPQYADAEIVSNITNLYLSPLGCSQI